MSSFRTSFLCAPKRRQLAILTAFALGAQLPGYVSAATPPGTVAAVAAETSPYAASRTLKLKQRGTVKDLLIDQRRQFTPHPYEASGYYATQGETLTIRYTPLGGRKPNVPPELWIVPVYNAADASVTDQVVKLTEGLNTVTVQNGGAIEFSAPNQPFGGDVEVEIVSGGHAMPHFVLGKHSKADWSQMFEAFPDAPYAELIGKRMSIVMPAGVLKQKVDDPVLLMQTWDRIVDATEEQFGLSSANARPHEATPFTYQFSTKPDSTGGYMSASSTWLRTNISGVSDVVSAAGLRTSWGPWHELGHHYQLPAIKWTGQTEVTVNLTSLYVQRMFEGQATRLEAGGVWTRTFNYLAQASRSYDELTDVWIRLAMYWQLDLAFGKDFYARFGALTRALPSDQLPMTDATKKQFLILQASRVSGYDLTPFFEKWGLPLTSETEAALKSLGLKTLDKPIWENHDAAVKYTYSLAEQNAAGKIVVPARVAAGSTFVAKVDVGNRDAGKLTYEWQIPEGFRGTASNSPQITLTAPTNVLQNSSAPIRVTVSESGQSMLIGSAIQLKTGVPTAAETQAFDTKVATGEGKSQVLTWSGVRTGVVGDVYAYDNPSSGDRDYFLLKTSDYGYFPLDRTSDDHWTYLTTLYRGGPSLSPLQAMEKKILADYGKTEFQSYSDSTTGTVGDLYEANNSYRGTVDFFKLKKASYWYFPTNQASNSYWEYLGSYDGTQYLAGPEPEVEPENHEPVAQLTGPESVEANAAVTLDASGSSDPDGDALTFTWQIPAGIQATPAGSKLSFVAPSASQAAAYIFGVTVSDGKLSTTAKKTVTVKAAVKPDPTPTPTPAEPPVASAGADRTVVGTSDYTWSYPLTGSASRDPAGQTLTYQWRAVSGPFSVRNGDRADAEVLVPKDTAGTGVFELKVTNAAGKTATASTKVMVIAPAVTLTGSTTVTGNTGSNYKASANFDQPSYAWTLADASGQAAASGSGAEWDLPVDVKSGNYTLTVRAESTKGLRSASAKQAVKVERAETPQPVEAKVSGPAEVEAGKTLTLTGTQSVNKNGTPTTYYWMVPASVGKNADTSSVQLKVPADAKPGTQYAVKLSVYDTQNKQSSTTNYTVTVKASSERPPEPPPGPDAYPSYQAGTAYKAGDIVLNKGQVYQCKPFPYGGWCSQSPSAYEPGKGWAWTDAWIKK
ncbi:M60 family metallopeptidase [Trinickia sp. YCB016]